MRSLVGGWPGTHVSCQGMTPEKEARLLKLLREWTIPQGLEASVHDAAQGSLNEVKALTEYQDGKVARLLTIVAFLSALAGAIFSRFATDYPLPRWGVITEDLAWLWAVGTYVLFGSYVVTVAICSFLLFGAIKPTFNEPEQWKAPVPGPPNSMTFYARILDADPESWGRTFVDLAAVSTKEFDAIKARYAKDYIFESYLVAEKVAEKLRRVAPAVTALERALLLLAGFLLCYGATLIALVPEQ